MKRIHLCTHSFISTFRLEKWNVMIEEQDWTVRNLARKVFSLLFSLLQIALCYRGSGLQPQKYPQLLLRCNTMSCHVLPCCTVSLFDELNWECRIQSDSRSPFCRDLRQKGRNLDLSTAKYGKFYCQLMFAVLRTCCRFPTSIYQLKWVKLYC